MAISITVQTARVTNGAVTIVFSDGSGATWPTLADFVAEQDQAVFEDRELLRRVALALIARRAPNLTNPAQIEGKTLTFDPTINNVMRII